MTHLAGFGLEFRNLTCARNGRALFNGLQLQLGAGELLMLQGANGAGKTSLLRMLCGLLEPTEGQIFWRGKPISELREDFGRDLIYLGHAAALKDGLSPLENLHSACSLAGHRVSAADARQALDAAGLRGYQNTLVRRLSQGQRRRCALARLALDPSDHHFAPLWILDEPFNALDTAAIAWLMGLIEKQLRRSGSVVLTSHQAVPLQNTPHQVLVL